MQYLVSIGWPLSTPRLNYFRDFFWRNPDSFVFKGILFERRLIDNLHSVPILELDDICAQPADPTTIYVPLTLNRQLLERCTGRLQELGIPTTSPAELIRTCITSTSTGAGQHSPFAEISIDDARELASMAIGSQFTNLAGLRSFDIVDAMLTAWRNFAWELFFDWTSDEAPDSPYSKWIDMQFGRGQRHFVVCSSRQVDLVDLVVHHGALHRLADYRVWLFDPGPDRRRDGRGRLHMSILGDRLGEFSRLMEEPALFLADSLDELLQATAVVRGLPKQSSAIVRLRKNIGDLDRICRALCDAGAFHQVEVDIHSADPSNLFAHAYPRRF